MSQPSGVESSLDRSLVSGIAWTAVLRWGAQLFSWVATFYAVRRLTPSDYGLISMAMVAIGVARMIEDLGMDSIMVQDRSILGLTQARLAGFLIGLGFTLSIVFTFLAQPLAAFFKEPQLTSIIRVLSLLFLFDAVQVVPRARLQRELQFRRQAIVAFVQVAATSIALVVSVRSGLGHWALVINTLGGATAATALLLCWYPYTVAWPSQIRKLSSPLLQGWRILASRAAWYAYSNADQTIIGRMLGKDALGTYSFAMTFSGMALQETGAIISRVVPGIFSEVQEKRDVLRHYFLLLTEFLAVLTFPAAVGLALTADLVVPLLMGPEWKSVVGPLRILCLYSVFLSAQTLTGHVLMWTGQFRVNMWCTILAGVTMPAAMLFAVRYGLEAIGWTWLLIFPLVNLPSMVFAFRTINSSFRQWLNSLKAAGLSCLVMAIAVLLVRYLSPATLSQPVMTVISIATGAVVYPAVLWLAFGRRVRSMLAMVRSMRREGGTIPLT